MSDRSQSSSRPSPAVLAAAFPVEADERELERFEQGVEVLLRGAAQQPDEGVDALLFVVAEDLGDLTLDRLLEGEEQATELMGFDVEQVIGACEAADVDGQFRPARANDRKSRSPGPEHGGVGAQLAVTLARARPRT